MAHLPCALRVTGRPAVRKGRPGILRAFSKILLAAVVIIELWMERARQRRQLARLDEFQLKDIGLSRADVEKEVSRPFWR